MKILLVAMPWQALSYPSLALGVLKEKAAHELPAVRVDQLYASLRFAEYLTASRPEVKWFEVYENIADTVMSGIGEWIFSGALNGRAAWNVERMEPLVSDNGFDPALVRWLHGIAPSFVADIALEIAAAQYDLVAFTSTFMQNVPSLAAARQIKKLSPRTPIAFGGANCDDVQGIALHRNFPWVDYVVRGEGERAFVQLIAALASGTGFEHIEGLCWRDGGKPVVNKASALLPMTELVEPDFDPFFEAVDASALRPYLAPQLVLEAARGCWWGEKHHCTFCGLNGSGLKFRSKDPRRVWAEIANAVRRYKTLDVMMVDNIMDARYVNTLLPLIETSDWDLRLHYEVKANLSADDLAAFKRAKVEHIQPGIESLSSRVLKLMRKGVTGGQNVSLLREALRQNLTVSWNYLYGFPGESDDDYSAIVEQVPNLYHLPPPNGTSRIAIERFSPLFHDPSLGVTKKWPARFYGLTYDLPESELEELVFLFEAPKTGLRGAARTTFLEAIADWKEAYARSTLYAYQTDARLVIDDRRLGRRPRVVVFDEPFEIAGYALLANGASPAALRRLLRDCSLNVDGSRFEQWWTGLRENALVFVDGERYTALAICHDPSNIRLDVGAA